MRTLHELAIKLQTFIVKCQEDAHNQTNMVLTKYNNLKLKIDTKYHFPNVIVCIGISEAVFNIKEGTKVDGGLGPDEKYVRKWLGSSTVVSDLNEIWLSMSDLIRAEEEEKAVKAEGEADEAKSDGPRTKHKPQNPELTTREDFFEITPEDKDSDKEEIIKPETEEHNQKPQHNIPEIKKGTLKPFKPNQS